MHIFSAEIPIPQSATVMNICLLNKPFCFALLCLILSELISLAVQSRVTVEPSGLNLIAFDSKFVTAC